MRAIAGAACLFFLVPADPASPPPVIIASLPIHTTPGSDVFQQPLATWQPHCLGFGSQWRYCNGAALRACGDGAVWLHTGVDIRATVGQPVMAAANGVIIGYLVDPQFRGGVLIRHQTTFGVVITQYWHVWLRTGFTIGSPVKRGQVFANIASMGDRTHFHFAVFRGAFDSHTWNGALPPSGCSGYPAFPYRFADPNAFLSAHVAAQPSPHGTRALA
ncbi:MAG TPA: M23 family metallopeptidase [Mycobacteriales bacterium]|nr:M23 family metallopeptidase [Mycobacteriales bacterium]